MSGNATPQFTKQGAATANQGVAITAANVKSDGTGAGIGTDMFLCMAADATNGSYVDSIRFMPTANTASTGIGGPTVGRVFKSSQQSGATTSANTHLIAEVVLPAVTADSTTTANSPIDVEIGERLPAGWSILVSVHAAPSANSSWHATPMGAGDY